MRPLWIYLYIFSVIRSRVFHFGPYIYIFKHLVIITVIIIIIIIMYVQIKNRKLTTCRRGTLVEFDLKTFNGR